MNCTISDFAQSDFTSEDVSFDSGGHLLRGKLFRPGKAPDAIVVLNGATGVSARFYSAFATWLAAERNMACVTFDYRDFGGSAEGGLRNSKATMADWGVHDQQAARDFAVSRFPNAPLWVIGHSLGALCLPFQKRLGQISRVITVASGPVHVREHPWPYQMLPRLFWFGHAPLAALVAGYLPGKALGLGSDLPAGVYWQWRRWCTSPDFFASEFGTGLPFPDWTGLKADMKIIAIADDVMMPPKSAWKLMQFYPEAPKKQYVIRPGDFGLSKLGHIGAFSEKNKAVWGALLA